MLNVQRLPPEDYLERFGIAAYMRDVLTLLLENRPEQPIEFVAEYFRNAVHGSSPLSRAYRYVRLTQSTRQVFEDNLCAAYNALASRKGSAGPSVRQFEQLVRAVCTDFPEELIAGVVRVLLATTASADAVTFAQFVAGLRAVLRFEEFLAEAERVFGVLDADGRGFVDADLLLAALPEGAAAGADATPADVQFAIDAAALDAPLAVPARDGLRAALLAFLAERNAGRPMRDRVSDVTFEEFALCVFSVS